MRAGDDEQIPVTLSKWSYKAGRDRNSEHYDITYTLRNGYDKQIKLIDDLIRFYDLLGESLYGNSLDKDVKIPPGKESTFRGSYSINQFIATQSRMKDMAQSDVVAKLEVRKIVFADNSIATFN